MKIKTYEELTQYATAAANGQIGLLVVVGSGGIGKSHTIKNSFTSSNLVLSSHLTPAACYEQIYNHKDDKAIFINDIDKLFNNNVLLSLLKQATETTKIKKLQYNSKTPLMADLPREFNTGTSIIIDTNEIPKRNKSLKALLSRGVYVEFEPTNEEVLKKLSTFARDEEIFNHIKRLTKMGGQPDFRKYVVAEQLKRAGLKWKNYLQQEMLRNKEITLLLEILEKKKTYKEQVKAWKEATSKSERTFNRWKKSFWR